MRPGCTRRPASARCCRCTRLTTGACCAVLACASCFTSVWPQRSFLSWCQRSLTRSCEEWLGGLRGLVQQAGWAKMASVGAQGGSAGRGCPPLLHPNPSPHISHPPPTRSMWLLATGGTMKDKAKAITPNDPKAYWNDPQRSASAAAHVIEVRRRPRPGPGCTAGSAARACPVERALGAAPRPPCLCPCVCSTCLSCIRASTADGNPKPPSALHCS